MSGKARKQRNNIFEVIEYFLRDRKIEFIFLSRNFINFSGQIQKIYPWVRIISLVHIPYIKKGLKELLCIIDLSRIFRYLSTTHLTFEDLLNIDYPKEYLKELDVVRRYVRDDATVYFFTPFGYRNFKNIEKIMLCAKFTDIELIDENLFKAHKRKLVKYKFEEGKFTIEETTSLKKIGKIQEFAKKILNDFNFDIRIDSLFNLYSDFFLVYNNYKEEEIISFARYTWYIPNHFLPCMLAVEENTSRHIKVESPARFHYAELFAPYINNVWGYVAYREITKVLLEHCRRINTYAIFTTCNANDRSAKHFFTEIFGFRDTGIVLKYGTFGGRWSLLVGEKDKIYPRIKRFLE
ncbi:MAG: hypothetical protein NC820_02490 [Candidatus Omnitrophica bacterium]|nr:hypothetical protein [Candidatus Omnitrophota bacterium]